MEHPELDINSIEKHDDHLKIIYSDNQSEILNISLETYKQMNEKWLKNTPMFLTDKHKDLLRNISFAAIQSRQICINELNKFFKSESEQNIKDFLIYMRKRPQKISEDKSKYLKNENI